MYVVRLARTRPFTTCTVIVVPIYYVSICFFSVLGGVMFFGEWDESSQMTVTQAALFLCGVGVIFYGVYLLTKDHMKVRFCCKRCAGVLLTLYFPAGFL